MILLLPLVILLGLSVGSFLNVVVWRVPRGESVVSPPSACPQCEQPIRARDNVPVVGWLFLRGRCRDCDEPISKRYPLVELGAGLVFAALTLRSGVDWELPAFLYMGAVGIALALIDLDVQRLPDVLTLPSYGVLAGLLTLASLAGDHPGALLRAGVGALALGGFYFAVWFAYPKGMGFGDVKLAPLIGALLGWVSYGALAVGAFAGFFFGGVLGVVLMTTSGVGRKTKLPFGPFMLLGLLAGVFVGDALADAYLSVTVG